MVLSGGKGLFPEELAPDCESPSESDEESAKKNVASEERSTLRRHELAAKLTELKHRREALAAQSALAEINATRRTERRLKSMAPSMHTSGIDDVVDV